MTAMTDEERRIIASYVERVSGAANAAPARPASPWGAFGGQQQPPAQPLPPIDREADALIGDLFARYPEARYRITQTAFVQEHALVEMQNRIQQLEWELENAQGQAQAAQNKGGLFGMFGGNRQAPPMRPRPQPQYPANYNPAAMQRSGPGFLGTAMMTAVGVAGGLLLGNALMSAFSGGAAEAATPGAGGFGQDAVPTSGGWGGAQDAAPADDAGAYDDGGYEEEI
jgi:hypothetical protein